jgi:hypothetical protein
MLAPICYGSVRLRILVVKSPITLRPRAAVSRLIWLLRAWRRALQHIDSEHPPDKEYRNNCPRNMDDPVATCFRTAKIEHDEIVARGSNQGSE